MTRRTLTEIANECGTDKGTVRGDGHGYSLIYEMFLAPYRDQAVNLLEIGLQMDGPEFGQPASRTVTDCPSVRTWHKYFPLAHIYGADISDFRKFQTDWFTFFQVDAGKADELERIGRSGVTLDVIVDDGSHASFHQQLALCTLFKSLRSGGLYFIEDLHWVPEAYQRELPQVPRTETILGRFLESGRFADTSGIPRSSWIPLEREIGNIVFFDEDTLVDARRLFNTQHAATPTSVST